MIARGIREMIRDDHEPIAESIYMDFMVFFGAVAVVLTMIDIVMLVFL